MNRTDLHAQVRDSIPHHDDEHDLDAIVDEIITTYGLVHIDTIDDDEYWTIVERNALDLTEYDAEHGYVAAIATAHDVAAGDHADVSVTEAAADLNVDEDGNETVTPIAGEKVVYGPVDTDVRTGRRGPAAQGRGGS